MPLKKGLVHLEAAPAVAEDAEAVEGVGAAGMRKLRVQPKATPMVPLKVRAMGNLMLGLLPYPTKKRLLG